MIKTRKKKARLAPIAKNKKNLYTFEGWEQMTGEHYHRVVRNYREDLYANFKPADLAPEVFAWMKENGYPKADIEAAKKRGPSVTLGITCKLLRSGMPDYNKAHDEYWQSLPGTSGEIKPSSVWVKAELEKVIAAGQMIVEETKEVEKEKANVYVPSIQERMRDAAFAMMEPIEEHLDSFSADPDKFDPKGIDVLKTLRSKQAKAAHARIIKSQLEPSYSELVELTNIPTAAKLSKMSDHDRDMIEQLKEGYSNYSKKAIKNLMSFYQDAIAACDMLQQEGKVTRKTRKPKEVNKEKLVAKIKYRKTDEALKLVSINPVDIVGASELWVYNVKTRKIGKYVAANVDPTGMGRAGSGLAVKGTTIQGYKEAESVQKTLRKPAEQLVEFSKAGKVALRKFLDEIKTTDIKLNGRINEDTVLLKVS